jgi:hypothetical protein
MTRYYFVTNFEDQPGSWHYLFDLAIVCSSNYGAVRDRALLNTAG